MNIKEEVFKTFYEFGILGLMLLYFMVQDHRTRTLREKFINKNIQVLEMVTEKVIEHDKRYII